MLNKENDNIKNAKEFKPRKSIISSLKDYLHNVISIRDKVDYKESVEDIESDIDFNGVNVWILGASIVIASIGLNVNSTAVIIGAMLVSPLMGPIVGIGLAVSINNFNMLIRSLKSLGTAVLISLIVSTIYFFITPFGEVQSELVARTKPQLLDVVIAFFSGVALIVAKTHKGKVASVIFGVAIATALMPPLCVAGYGLANGEWNFFIGAFYLFLINSVFIILATIIIIKYLRFPMATYANLDRRKKVKRYFLIFSALIVIPSGFTFWRTIQESLFENNAKEFITENFEFDGTWVTKQKLAYASENPECLIEIYLAGELISGKEEQKIKQKLGAYNLKGVTIKIHQYRDKTEEVAQSLMEKTKLGILEDIYEKNALQLNDKDKKIAFLEDELIKERKDTIPFYALKREINVQYKEALSMSLGKTISTNFEEHQDTNITFFIKWKDSLTTDEISIKQKSMENWLKVRLNDEKVRVLNH